MRVVVKFLCEGGRKSLPTGSIYTTQCRIFNPDTSKWSEDWSFRIKWDKPPESFFEKCYGDASFLSSLAPVELLVRKRTFHLYEGNKEVGYGALITR